MNSPKRRHDVAGRSRPGTGGIAADAFGQLALWTAANLAGLVTALTISRGPFFRKLMARVGGRRTSATRPSAAQSLPILANAVLGSSKASIASVFGPPRAAVMVGAAPAKSDGSDADTWYYPLPRNGPMAMAINFDEGFAKTVEFFQAPGVE